MSSEPGKPAADLGETVVGGVEAGGMNKTVVAGQGEIPEKSGAPVAKETVIGDFKVIRKLGQGGMGAVYLAHQISLDRPCALKVMAKELAKKPGFTERFIREARAMAKMQHPHVVSCYAVAEDKGMHYVAMELMDGQSMQAWVDQLKTLSVADALLITLVVADALQHAHDLSMIHRDIKPDNILVTKKGVVKVADLGLAKSTDEDMSMTQSGTGLGTPHYMPPEQARNAKHVDNRCDIYALGVTLYHFVTGKVPFSGDSIVDLITNKEKGTFTPAHRVNNKVPERLSLMIDKSMAKDPKARYQSMRDFIKDLESLGQSGDTLSFIDHPQKVVMRGGSTSSASFKAPAAKLPPAPSTKAASGPAGSRSAVSAPAAETGTWFVRQTINGKPSISRMTQGQILAAIKTDKLDTSTQLAQDAKGPFRPLPQVPAFEDEARRMITRQHANAKSRSLADEYAKIEKQYDRRKWWQMLARFRDGTMGFVGLLIYLAVIVAIGVALWYFIPIGYKMLEQRFKLK
jgi:serine/threonine protein kinase